MTDLQRVLVLEDNPDHLRLYRKTFARHNWEVLAVSTRDEAERWVQTLDFRVVVCDMHLGDELGIHFIREYRDHFAASGTHIVVVSAHEHYRAECEALGVYQYLVKPISPRNLNVLIERLLYLPGV
ncbi:MAG: response regulator [bacterium]|nr:response regulator [bacterium]